MKANTPILVWDIPTRVFHWLLAIAFAGAYITSGEEEWDTLHAMFGYTLLGLIAFRLLWGLIGSRYARFSQFAAGPGRALTYLRSLHSSQPEHHIGHNPAGGLAIFGLLALGLLTGATGLMHYKDIGGEWLGELHDVLANAMLTLVIVHIAAVIASSRLHGENLARAMVTGKKLGQPEQAISKPYRLLGLVILLTTLGFGSVYAITNWGEHLHEGEEHAHQADHDD